MTIKELTIKLKSEFEDFEQGYDYDYEYGCPLEGVADEFAMDYFGNVKEAISFLNGLNVVEFMQIESGMAEFYDDPTVVLSWLDDPQEMANEVVGFVVRNYVIN